MTLRHRLAKQLDPALKTSGLSVTNKIIVMIILVSLLVAILETEHAFYLANAKVFKWLDWTLIVIFMFEYTARVWVCVENPHYKNRWNYITTPSAILDLLMVVLILLTDFGTTGFILRLARLLRILRIAKMGRYSRALKHLKQAIFARRDELLLSLGLAMIALLLSAIALYLVEGTIQPDKFGSIPRAMWWAVTTLTTVGYGDVYPITPAGRVLASITAFAGIGLIAMPAGILAGSFSEAMQKWKNKEG